MNEEKKKLLITITILLVLIIVMVISQVGGEKTEVPVDDDGVEVIEVVDVVDDTGVADEIVIEDELPIVSDEPIVEVNDGIIIEDITEEVKKEAATTREYLNESLGISYSYPVAWSNDENSVPGLYTVRSEIKLEGEVEAYARVDFRYYTATVDTDSVVLTNIAGVTSFFDENKIAQEVVTIPLKGEAKIGVGEWVNNALQVTYGIYSEDEVSNETLEYLFDVNMGDFNEIIGSLKLI